MKAQVENFTLPKLPASNKALVYVVRPSLVGWIVRFNVFVDDKEPQSEVGYTRGGQYIYFELEPGQHQILSKADNWAETTVVAEAGDIIFVMQEVFMGMPMARNKLFRLDDYEGKYHIKTLSTGTMLKSNK
ncbi:hypothetical protein A9Q99_02920 [Gammaproteobacteria bacterium 45_16_T64]|nr:hypothetical protein A9Q99_02920 [Gammaproteobacteria bacterium 45_16_T64]